MNLKHAYLVAFVLASMVIAYEDVHQCHRLPWPPRFIAAGLVFSLLSLFSIVNEELPAVIAVGIVLATLVNKGFINDCTPHTTATTAQPGQAQFLASSGTQNEQPPDTGFLAGSNQTPGQEGGILA